MPRPLSETERKERLLEPRPVFVPRDQHLPTLAEGSGIIGGEESSEGRIIIYFEGNIHGAANIKTFADRLNHAHGRWATKYPTGSMRSVALDTLYRVGIFDPLHGIVHVEEPAALKEWLGGTLEAEELLTTDGASRQRREVRDALTRSDLDEEAERWVRKRARSLGIPETDSRGPGRGGR